MDFGLDFINPEEDEGLDKNEEGEGVYQPHSEEYLNKCTKCCVSYAVQPVQHIMAEAD